MHIQANQSLKPYNTFHIDVKTQYLIEVSKQSDIPTLRSDMKLASLPWYVLGEGSNVLFTHDIQGVTVRCGYKNIRVMKEDKESIWLSVGAGMNWHEFVTYTVERGYWGLENLALIPGTVGAAPVQNIGAYGTEARDVITRVQTLNLLTGERQQFRNAECEFDYRTSIFKREYANKLLVHRVTFKLLKKEYGHPDLTYEPIIEAVSDVPKENLTPKKIYDAIIAVRRERLPDPNEQGNAGSFFKNPVVSAEYFETLIKKYPEMPHHRTLEENYKIPAGWLIEKAGWKGKKMGRAAVSEKHALVLVNLGGATGEDILALATAIQEDVNQKFGIHLEPEVTII
jgi:UDP-N-acetylmuramate dehydrogenase